MIRLKEREVVIVGGGLTAGLVARRLVPAGRDVLVLERGPDRSGGPEDQLPSQRDDLRWNAHRGLTQRENVETLTLRHKRTSRPCRCAVTSFLPGFGVGGAISHWNGQNLAASRPPTTSCARTSSRATAAARSRRHDVRTGYQYDDLEPTTRCSRTFSPSRAKPGT